MPPHSAAERIVREIGPGEFNRVLGMPRRRVLAGDLASRATWARAWYAAHGRPYACLRRHAITRIERDEVHLAGGRRLLGRVLADRLRRDEAHALIAMAVSAGPEAGETAAGLWQSGRPDEGYFLDRLGVAVVEQLLRSVMRDRSPRSEGPGERMTPHCSPGCGGWELEHQAAVWGLLYQADDAPPIRLLPSGALLPTHAVLAVAGVTRRQVRRSPQDVCRRCDLVRCRLRRATYGGGR